MSGDHLLPDPGLFLCLAELILCIMAVFLGLRLEESDQELGEAGGEIELGKFGMKASSTFSKKSSEVRS